MDKYQEALDDVFSTHPMSKERNLECKKLLQELVDKTKLRTEEEVLKDFEKLGYKIVCNNVFTLRLINNNDVLNISKSNSDYSSFLRKSDLSLPITLKEHKLLNELFKIWNWL